MLPDSENRNQKYNPNQTFSDGKLKLMSFDVMIKSLEQVLDILRSTAEYVKTMEKELTKKSSKWAKHGLKLEIFNTDLTDWNYQIFTSWFKIINFNWY